MTGFVVEGNDRDGAAVTRNVPVLVGGVDGSGIVQTFQLGTDGSIVGTRAAGDAVVATALEGVGLYVFNGASWDRCRSANVFKVTADTAVTAGTPIAIWTPTSSKKFRWLGFSFSVTTAANLILKDGSTEFFRSPKVGTNGTYSIGSPTNPAIGYLSSAANNVLNADVSATTNVSGTVWGCEE